MSTKMTGASVPADRQDRKGGPVGAAMLRAIVLHPQADVVAVLRG